jgi:hypothetical protein
MDVDVFLILVYHRTAPCQPERDKRRFIKPMTQAGDTGRNGICSSHTPLPFANITGDSHMPGSRLLTIASALFLASLHLQAQLAPPTLASPSNRATAIRVKPVFVWRSTQFAFTHDLQVSSDSTFSGSVTTISGLADTSYQFTGLSHSVVYFWRVRAVNPTTTGPYSLPFSFKTRAPSPALPVGSHDAYPALLHVAGITILTGDAFETADVSGDNTVSAYDAALVFQFAAGLINLFPVDQ